MTPLPRIRPVEVKDRAEWLRMRDTLYGADASLAEEIDAFLEGRNPHIAVLVAERRTQGLCGLIEAGTRPYAEGCRSSPVGYIEGLYVDPDMRRSGLGRRLIDAAIDWAKTQGLTEMASDALITNDGSIAFHVSQGFEIVERIVCFRRAIG